MSPGLDKGPIADCYSLACVPPVCLSIMALSVSTVSVAWTVSGMTFPATEKTFIVKGILVSCI